jgi:DNA-binding HxlR family transcriptional regulator
LILMARAYGQFCGLARALELVGGRWSLLIVRELLLGPKRYTELAQALPGIPTNVLSSRLRELEDADLVQRALQDRPSTAVVYELTPYGLDLEEPVISLGLWGARSLARPTASDRFSVGALTLALRGVFDPDAAQGHDLDAEVRFDHGCVRVVVEDGTVAFPAEPAAEPDLVLATSPDVFAEIFGGYTDIDAAVASGRVRIEGTKKDARRFFEIFALPTERADVG